MRKFRYVLVLAVCLGFLSWLAGQSMAQQQRVTENARLEELLRAGQESAVASVTDFNGDCPNSVCRPGPDAPECDECTSSLGKFRIYINKPFRPLFVGCPLYQNTICGVSTNRLESPNLSDPATVIGRSAPQLHGSATDTNGIPVGDAGTLVKDSDFTVLPSPNFQGPNGSREIHTEIVSLNLSGFGANVRAGSLAPSRPKSIGEVESKSSGGLPANDFPADSFFDVFVEVDLPPCGSFPGATVYNKDALLVVNTNVTDLPPQVVYIHGNSTSVAVYFKTTGPGPWVAGDILGWLSLAGHGVGEGAQQLETAYCAATEMTVLGACCLPDGSCELRNQTACEGDGGRWAGEGNACSKCGACCLANNGCELQVLDTDCHNDFGGHFLGIGTTSCPHNPNGSCTLGACCRPNNVCTLDTTADECIKLGGRYLGDGSTTCAHDASGDCIPTVSEWGLVVMAILVLSAATVVIMRRRAMVHG